MNFRFKEILRYLIPGFFIILILIVLLFSKDSSGILGFLKDNKDAGIPTALLFVVPLAAYFIGYFIEYIASNVEYVLYKWDILRRPSYVILNNKTERYGIANYEVLKKKLGISENTINSNKDAKKFYNKAKQNLKDLTFSEEFFYLMLVARNLFFSEVILLIIALVLACFCCISWWIVLVLALLAIMLFHRWRQRSFTLTKHVLIQFVNGQ